MYILQTIRYAFPKVLTRWVCQPDQIHNSPYHQPYNSYNVSSKNLVLDQLIIPE